MVIVALNGRLGNQLFQYAFALSLSFKFKTFYLIDDSKYKDNVIKYFEPLTPFDYKLPKKFIRKLATIKNFSKLCQTGFEQNEFDFQKLKDNCRYEGFFQSSTFFSPYSTKIRNKLKIRKNFLADFDDKYGSLFQLNKVLVIHYRLGDYLTWDVDLLGGSNMVLPEEYYIQALSQIPNLESYKVVVVTDDKENITNKLSFLKEKIIVSDSEISDFQMLMHADKLIISNSTFAWWGAYLNVKNAEVFAPQYWIGFKVRKEFPCGILPQHFNKVQFT